MHSEGFPFISGGLGVGPCLPTVGLAFAAVRCRPPPSVVLRYCRADGRRSFRLVCQKMDRMQEREIYIYITILHSSTNSKVPQWHCEGGVKQNQGSDV